MKFCISSRQTMEYLRKADEIKIQYRDRKSISDFPINYPGIPLVLECSGEIDWGEIKTLNILSKNNLTLCLYSLKDCVTAHEKGFKFYLDYEINSFYDLNSYIALEPSYVIIGAPLFFNLEKVKRICDIPIRVCPNRANQSSFPNQKGIFGTWIRPEDLHLYEKFITTIEFKELSELSHERALYRIYAEQKEWNAGIELLIQDIGIEGSNRLFLPEAAKKRLNCKQRCQEGSSCRICETAIVLANTISSQRKT